MTSDADILAYYRAQSDMSDPGNHAARLDALPKNVPDIVRSLQGLIIHVLHGRRYGVEIPTERMALVEIRPVSAILEKILNDDARPLYEPREPVARFAGTCRHYAVVLTAFLRHKEIPARARNGFSDYLKKDVWSDHWVCEYWNGENWILVDAQMDAEHIAALGIDFPPLNVPRGRQVLAGEMWRRCRSGHTDPATCGSMKLWGLDYVRGNLIRDIAALNKQPMLPWDGSPLSEKPASQLTAAEYNLLDRLADATAGDVNFDFVQSSYARHRDLHVDALPMKAYT